MSGRRKIKIILDQRSAEDSSRLLDAIAKSFPKHNISIKIETKGKGDSNVHRNENLENQIIADTKKVLDSANSSYTSGATSVEQGKTNAKGKLRDYLEKLSFEGIKVGLTTAIKGAIEFFLK